MKALSVEEKDLFKSEVMLSENALEFASAVLSVDQSVSKVIKAPLLNQCCQRMCAQILLFGVGR